MAVVMRWLLVRIQTQDGNVASALVATRAMGSTARRHLCAMPTMADARLWQRVVKVVEIKSSASVCPVTVVMASVQTVASRVKQRAICHVHTVYVPYKIQSQLVSVIRVGAALYAIRAMIHVCQSNAKMAEHVTVKMV